MTGIVPGWMSSGAPARAVGFDIGASSVKTVVAKRSGRQVRIVRCCSIEIPREAPRRPSPEETGAAIKRIVEEHKLAGVCAVSAFPLFLAIVRSTVVPLQGRSKIRQAIKFHAEPHIPFPIEDVVVDFHENGQIEGEKTPLIIMGAKKEILAKHLERLAAGGVDPEIVSVDAAALINNYLLRAAAANPEELVVLLDIGATKTLLVVMRGRYMRLARSIAIGGDDVTEAIQRAFSIGFEAAEALKREKGSAVVSAEAGPEERRLHDAVAPVLSNMSREVDRSLRSLAVTIKDTAVSRIFLSGGGSLLKGMNEFCAKEFGCEADYLSCLSPFQGSPDDACMCAVGIATGLAIQGVGLGAAPIDLRREEFAHAGTALKARRQAVVAAALGLCIVGLLGYGFARSFLERRSEYAALCADLEGIYRETFPAERPVKAIAVAPEMMQRLKEYQKSFESFSVLSSDAVSSLEILREVSSLVPQDLKAQVTKLVIGQDKVEMDGLVNNPGDADKIKLALQKSKYFTSVDVPSTSAHGGTKHKFELVARIRR